MSSAAAKVSEFQRQGNDWYCKTGLPSDITVVVDDVKFHLHKFPLVSKCGKLARMYEDSKTTDKKPLWTTVLEDFPGGPETFLTAARFCYGARTEITSKNLVSLHCAAEYLEMTGEDNLISQAETFLHKQVLRSWKDCISALQSSTHVSKTAERIQTVIPKLMNAVSTMVCTDPSLFGWPMMMYGTLQSPGGSILWNGINTGARMRRSSGGSDWWYEDVSCLSVELFKRLIKTMEAKGIRVESLVGAMMYYARKYLPGLGRWQSRTSFSLVTASSSSSMSNIDQIGLLETIVSFLPEKRGRSFCRFLLCLLRLAFILGVDGSSVERLEKKIGMQLELATLENVLILNYSDSETLYNVDCVERMIGHFVSSTSSEKLTDFSPLSLDQVMSPPSSLRKVGKLVDSYMAEVASDVNLKPDKMKSLAAALPECARTLYDGLYRAFDIYFKEHPWLSDQDKEQLCNTMDYHRLSIDACAHASHNERLPLRVVLQVLFFEQMHLRTALASTETGHGVSVPREEIVQRDGWVTVVRQNQVLKVNMQKMRSRVGELEEEFRSIKQEMKKKKKGASKSSASSVCSPRLVKMGCKFLLPRASDAKNDIVQSSVSSTPRSGAAAAHALPRSSRHSKHRKSFSLFG